MQSSTGLELKKTKVQSDIALNQQPTSLKFEYMHRCAQRVLFLTWAKTKLIKKHVLFWKHSHSGVYKRYITFECLCGF